MATNGQITRRIIWYHIKRDGKPALAIAMLLLAIVGAYVWIDHQITSKVINETTLAGTIETAQTQQTDPAAGTGSGYSYQYSIRLDDEGLVFASESASIPKRIGEKVHLIRSHRENGLSTYRFAEKLDDN